MDVTNITTQETANGRALTLGDVTIVFPFGGTPHLVFGAGGYTKIDEPERFGTWDSWHARSRFIHAFVNAGSAEDSDNG